MSLRAFRGPLQLLWLSSALRPRFHQLPTFRASKHQKREVNGTHAGAQKLPAAAQRLFVEELTHCWKKAGQRSHSD